MNQAVSQQNLEAVMTNLLPLVSFVNGKNCDDATAVLLKLLVEALDAQEASLKRAADLKTMNAKDLLSLLTPVKPGEKVVVHAPESTPTNKKTLDKHPRGGTATKSAEKKKRERKPAGNVMYGSEDGDEWDEEQQKKPKKKSAKTGTKVADGSWNGEEFPRITKVVKCQGEGLDFRMDVSAKKSGRGHWIETYTLDFMDLCKVDCFSEANKGIVAESCRKALTQQYGLNWPNQVRSALAATVWGQAIIPKQEATVFLSEVAGEGDNFNFGSD